MRSLLFVPAVERMLYKIPQLSADAFIVDLEDSIPDDKKVEALELVKTFLTKNTKKVYIRLDEKHFDSELQTLESLAIEGYMIPKFENPDNYSIFEHYFYNRFVIALVETPSGIANLEKIASCKWVNAIAFGAEDYTSSVGMLNRFELLVGIRNMLVMYAKAFHKPVYDSPSLIIDNTEELKREIQLAKDMGFDGKMAINPIQISLIDSVYKSCDIEHIKSIIDRYKSSGKAVVKIDGKVYEKMHINKLEEKLKENNC